MSESANRLKQNKALRQKIAQLQMRLLDVLEERLNDDVAEAQEMRIILELAKFHAIGVDTVEDLVEQASEEEIPELDEKIKNAWSFQENE